MSDPYEPPSSRLQQPQPALYSLSGVVIATVLGSLAAAVVILYQNYRSLGSAALANRAAVVGMIIYLLLIGIAALLPDSMVIGGLFIVIQTSIAYAGARQLQGDAIAYHHQHGGAIHSNLRAAGVGLLTGVAIIVVFLVLGTVYAVATAG